MDLLKKRIEEEGKVIGNNILKVDNFLNHQIDVELFIEMGKEFKNRFAGEKVDKIITIEASGIAIAFATAQAFGNVPVVFAKKQEAGNLSGDVYSSNVFSFTKNKEYVVRVDKKYINKGERVLIIDDFLANGQAALGLMDIIDQAGALAVGAGIVIEKGFQDGKKLLLEKNLKVESLAIIKEFSDNKVIFGQ